MASNTDDSNVFFDRSLGTVQLTPNTDQLGSAIIDPANAFAVATHDGAGNLSFLSDSATNTQYNYGWDELGRLTSATRTDGGNLAAQEEFAYDSTGLRVRTTRHHFTASGIETSKDSTINASQYLVLEQASFPDSYGVNYQDDSTTENIYVPWDITA